MNNTNEILTRTPQAQSTQLNSEKEITAKFSSPNDFIEPEFKVIRERNKKDILEKGITSKFLDHISKILVLMVIIVQLIVLYRLFD
jgi:hypothetical protein